MSLIKCNECNKEISSTAESCPHCGAKPYKSYQPSGCFLVIIFLVVLIIIVGLLPSNKRQPEKKSSITPYESAGGACLELIKLSLHDPDSAIFEHSSKNIITEESGNIYIVKRNVTAKNAFNAMRKSTFECKMRFDNDSWHAISIIEK